MQETQFQTLGQEDLLEKEMAAHSNILAWKSHGQRRAWKATFHGVAELGMTEHTTHTHTHTHTQSYLQTVKMRFREAE